MDLERLIHGLGINPLGGALPPGVRVTDITEDSRTAMPGSLFIARRGGTTDGRQYIGAAVKAGAAAVLVERAGAAVSGGASGRVPMLECEDVPLATAQLAERFYGDPSKKLVCVGVTGTNGKTTTTWLVHQLLNGAWRGHGVGGGPSSTPQLPHHLSHPSQGEPSPPPAPMRCGLMGTVVVDDGVEVAPASLTTAPALEVSRTLARMLESGCRAAVMETSSHALDQKRVAAPGGVRFKIGVFTNLTRDHLDYHKTMEAYADAKALLLASLPPDGAAVVNADDPAHVRMLRDCRAKVVRCSVRPRGAGASAPVPEWIGRVESMTAAGMTCLIDGPWRGREAGANLSAPPPWRVRLPLVGGFNLMNVLQAAAVAYELGLDGALIREGLEHCQAPPGRMERVTGWDDPWAVYVDYAHTDDALERVLAALREVLAAAKPQEGQQGVGRLMVVFGCGGNRDSGKRARMGEVASRLADRVMVTSDNPRLEDPLAIIKDILSGVPAAARGKLKVEPDRQLAIDAAVAELVPGDVLVVAGKGHEDYQILPDGRGGTIKRPFDDRVVANQAISRRRRAAAGAGGSA